jgi:hypothetical protein
MIGRRARGDLACSGVLIWRHVPFPAGYQSRRPSESVAAGERKSFEQPWQAMV